MFEQAVVMLREISFSSLLRLKGLEIAVSPMFILTLKSKMTSESKEIKLHFIFSASLALSSQGT